MLHLNSPHTGYTTIINLLDYTSVVVPVTHVSALDSADPTFTSLSGAPEDEKAWASYDAAMYDGACVGLQVVGRRLQEERVLAIAEVLMESMGG